MPEESAGFGEMGIDPAILKSLEEMGFEEPSPIQVAAIPPLLEGRDVIGQAQTGTGKTAAFGIPLLQRLRPDMQRPQALVLAPTRELALQVAEEIGRIGKHLRVRELAVYGGSPIDRQIRSLRAGVEVVVGTPGRVMDHLDRGTLKLDQIRMFVLDEADEMLDMGFVDDIEKIMGYLPAERQTVCFSATMPDPILRITRRHMHEPVQVSIAREELTGPTIEQAYFEIRERDRVDALTRIIDHEDISPRSSSAARSEAAMNLHPRCKRGATSPRRSTATSTSHSATVCSAALKKGRSSCWSPPMSPPAASTSRT